MYPNILLIVLDSVRARNTSLYGYDRPTTPFLSSLCSQATLYKQARAPSTLTLPSHASLFTGLHVLEHRLTNLSWRLKEESTIWETLGSEHGYATGLFTSNAYLTAGFDHAFDVTVDGSESADETANAVDVAGSMFVDAVLSWTNSCHGPWAACVNLMDAHRPYLPAPKHDHWSNDDVARAQANLDHQVWDFVTGRRPWSICDSFELLYSGAIRQLDAQVQTLVSKLKARGDLEETLLVITADHGEGFGEQSRIRPDVRIAGHLYGAHEVLLHVPLLVLFPGQTQSKHISQPADLTRFPEAVRSSISDNWTGQEFVPDTSVIASAFDTGIHPTDYGVDISFVDPVHVMYELDGEHIRKSVVWGSDRATIDIQDAFSARLSIDDPTEGISPIFGSLSAEDVSEYSPTFEMETSSVDLQHRLQYLGYR